MRRGSPTVPLWWHPRSFHRLRSSGSRPHWAGRDEMDAARKRSLRRLSRPTAAGQGLAPTTAGNAADSVGAGTRWVGAGSCGLAVGGVEGFGGVEGWRRRGGRSLLRARRVRLGERHRLGVGRAWSRWSRTRWWWWPVHCESPRLRAELILRRHGRRPRRIASRVLVAGRTERRIAEDPPKRLLIR
jgi:hypothetical protein